VLLDGDTQLGDGPDVAHRSVDDDAGHAFPS
jgi:hypothetical protein